MSLKSDQLELGFSIVDTELTQVGHSPSIALV